MGEDWETEIFYRGRPLSDYRAAVIDECDRVWLDEIAEWANTEGISFDATTRLSNQLEAAIRALKDKT